MTRAGTRRRPGASGAVLAEYVLLAGLIAAVVVSAARLLGPVVVAKFESGVGAFVGPGSNQGGGAFSR